MFEFNLQKVADGTSQILLLFVDRGSDDVLTELALCDSNSTLLSLKDPVIHLDEHLKE